MACLHPLQATALRLTGLLLLAAPLAAQQTSLPAQSRFHAARPIPQTIVRTDARLQKINLESRSAISLAAGNFFEDGYNGLVTGYSLGSGGILSVQKGNELPQDAEIDNKFAFSAKTSMISLGLRPDFLKAADLNGDGHQDLVAASNGGNTIQVLAGDGKGNFTAQTPITVAGKITSLATWHSNSGPRLIAAGICSSTCAVTIFNQDGSVRASLPISDTITMIATARLNGNGIEDIVAGGASRLVIFDGKTLGTAAARVDTLPVSNAVAVATGAFVYDRRMMMQVAVLTSDGTIHTFARSGLIATPPAPLTVKQRIALRQQIHPAGTSVDIASLAWTEVETLSAVAVPSTSSTSALIRTRISGSGMDDLMAVNVNGGQSVVVRHPVVAEAPDSGSPSAGTQRALPAVIETEPNLSGQTLAAIPLRINQNASLGLVSVDGAAAPKALPRTSSHYFYVTTTADGAINTANCPVHTSALGTAPALGSGNCTLRDAIHAADNEAAALMSGGKADTISIPAGTFQLSNNEPVDGFGDAFYHVEIYAPVNILGAGANATLITANNNDKIFSENSADADAQPNQQAMDFYMSGVQLYNGTNPNPVNSDNVGGLMDADTGGTGNITFVNCTFTGGTDKNGSGGGLFIGDNALLPTYTTEQTYDIGIFELDNSTVSNNITGQDGGGIYLIYQVPILFNGDTISGNASGGNRGTSQTGIGSGAGLYFGTLNELYCSGSYSNQYCSPHKPTAESLIENSTFTNNAGATNSNSTGSVAYGGAIAADDGLDITGSTFTGNSTQGFGGAVYLQSNDAVPTITGNVVTGNSAKDGGGFYLTSVVTQGTDEPITINYNAIYGNTATAGKSGISVGVANSDFTNPAAITAKYNFWGCNTGANTTNCDTTGGSGPAITLTPYAVVTAALTPNGQGSYTNGSNITLTGGITTDSTGASLGTANEAGFNGLATTQNIMVGSTTVVSGTPSTGSTGTASINGTINAAGSGTAAFTIKNATVNLTFTAAPPAPTANAQSFSTPYATPHSFTLSATGTGPFTYTVVTPTSHGSLSGTAPNLIYTPNAGFVGSDSLTFTASNTSGPSSPATVSITVQQITPGISLTAPATANRGTASALTATLTVPTGAPTPTAQVKFYSTGNNLLGAASLTGGGTTYTATLNAIDIPGGAQTLTATYPGDSSYVTVTSSGQSTVATQNNLWIGNSNNTTTAYDATGTAYHAVETSGGYGGVAIDPGGNVWSTQGTQLAEYAHTGAVLSTSYGANELNSTSGIVIDANANVWVLNHGNSTVAAFADNGNPLASAAYAGAYLSSPTGIAVDISGNLWISNHTGAVTELLGASTPTVPLAKAVTNNTPAARP